MLIEPRRITGFVIFMPLNTLISIGYLGIKTCYLNIPLEEAKKRYLAANPDETDQLDKDGFIQSFSFKDQFSAYEIGEDPDRDKIVSIVSGNSDGTDGSGNEYELLSLAVVEQQEQQEEKQAEEELEEDAEDKTISLLESRAKDLSYAFAHNPDLLSRKLKESLISIAGPEASKAYHISAYYDGKDINFNISRLSPRFIIKIETDFKAVDIGAKYYNTVSGWVVAAGLSVSCGWGFNSPDDSDIKAQFSVTVSR